MSYPLVKSLLFRLSAEDAHDLTLRLASLAPWLGSVLGPTPDERCAVTVGSCQWRSPLGLAAGLDKNAEALDFLAALGFGAIECGTITLRPQAGNSRPRIFRYPAEESLRNSMGFPNQGLAAIWPRLRRYQGRAPVGANIGKNKDSDRSESIEELSLLAQSLEDHVDYLVVNVSSPNTPGLRAFQERGYLLELFAELRRQRGIGAPDLFLKIAPDLEPPQLRELIQIAQEAGLTGIIATNTTVIADRGTGGFSGQALRERARAVRQLLLAEASSLELIGVGGVKDFSDLLEFWELGGKAMQAYTAFVYQGPELLSSLHRDLRRFLDQQGLWDLESFFTLSLAERRARVHDFRSSRP